MNIIGYTHVSSVNDKLRASDLLRYRRLANQPE